MPQSEGPVRIWIKPKVLAGFIIILAFAIAAISITYDGFVELSRTKQSLSHPNKKLITLNAVLADIYEAESNIRTYTLTHNEDFLNIYFSFLIKINNKVDSLLVLTKDNSGQKAKIKVIKQLLERKGKILDELLELKKRDHSSIFYDRALDEIAKVKSNPSIRKPLLAKTTTTVTSIKDTVVEKQLAVNAGFFGKIKNWISGNNKVDTTITDIKVETRIDTLLRTGYVSDSIVGNVISILNQIRKEQETVNELVSQKELELLSSDKEIMDQIRIIVSLLEREELSQSYKRSNDAEEVVHKSTIIVLALGGAALIMLLLFLAVIFRDITKGNFYRNQLYEAKKYAEKLLKVKEQFLANMSHEIRTPLSSIIGLSRQIERTELDTRQAEYIKLLTSSSNHLLGVINDILDFSKIEAGQLKIETLPFNLAELLQESINTMREKANEKGIDLKLTEGDIQNITLWGDPFRLKQILLNLLSNAIKFTEKGSVTVSALYSDISEETVKVHIKVTDTGIGISPEQQSLIFEEFTQADPSTTRKYGGTGLGLTIVKRLTELQGGEVSVESKQNVGTSIGISIPYRLKGELVEKKVDSRNQIELSANFKVLLVDDDEVNRVISLEMFKSLGLSANATGNAKEVIDLISNDRYNIVFTDIHMPEVSGYDLANMINELGFSIPIIAITANSMIDNPDHFTSRGFSGYLIKPFSEDEIIRIIEPFVEIKQPVKPKKEIESDTSEGYDLSDIYRFAGDDMQSAKLILSTFLVNTDRNLADLNSFVKAKELYKASEMAHKMKSAFNQFKIYNIAGLLLKIEKLEDKQDNLREVKILTEELNNQIKPILKSLKKELVKISE
ncbi:MAG: ATP-binding protein [Tenuifilaceae bacterium]